MKKNLIILLCLIGTLALVMAAPAPAQAGKIDDLYEAAKKEGQVVWQSIRPPENFKELVNSFQKRFPGIKLTVIRVSGTKVPQRLIAEAQANRVSIDVGSTAIGPGMPLIDRDLLVSQDYTGTGVNPKDLVLDGKMLFARDTVIGVVYNTKLVAKKDVPRKWEDLINPKWRSKIAVIKAGAGFAGVASIWDDAKLVWFLKELTKLNVQIAPGSINSLNRVSSGELAFTTCTTLDETAKRKAMGAPVDVAPLSPIYAAQVNLFMIKGVPHPNAAKLFMIWMGSPEGRKALAKAEWGPVNPCGPTLLDKMLCGKNLDIYRLNTIARSKEYARTKTLVVKTLGLVR